MVKQEDFEYYKFGVNSRRFCSFIKTSNSIHLDRLFGIPCALLKGKSLEIAGLDMFNIDTDLGKVQGSKFVLVKEKFTQNGFFITWDIEDLNLRIETSWEFCTSTYILKRSDSICNTGTKPVTINKCLARFSFPSGLYEIYSQASSWCRENQGRWQKLYNGTFEIVCEGGRTTQGSTPFICLRETGHEQAVAFHLIPNGNWVMRAMTRTGEGDSLPRLIIDIGMSDNEFRYCLEAGETIKLPEILIQGIDGGEPYKCVSDLHEYLLKNTLNRDYRPAPVVYNTWFDDFDYLNVNRLRNQLKAAKKIGCEVFVIDAGWYGAGEGSWSEKVGDWRERTDAAFCGKMFEFSEEVRSEGLGFGIWLEPERVSINAPVFKEHKDWFIKSQENWYYPDLSRKEVYDYYLEVISGLIEKYGLAWIKVDFNFELSNDPYKKELYGYYKAWYKLLDELHRKYPHVFLEGCSSGAMRLDLSTLKHFDCHFLSDNVNPKDVLRIYQNALLRLPPGLLGKWIVLRSVGKTIAQYGTPIEQARETIVTPMGATWEGTEKVDLDFAVRVGLAGAAGFSGDISSLSEEVLERLKFHVDFYKVWRSNIFNSKAYLLTPPAELKDNKGWAAYQLQDINSDVNLVFIYRLDDSVKKKYFYLCGLKPDMEYKVWKQDESEADAQVFSGEQLMNEGICVELSNRYNGEIFIVVGCQES